MPTLLAPWMLTALAALAVPLAIHLWSRGEARRVQVGSIRFLEEAETRQARRLRLTQVPLLAVRMALLAVLAVLLARPVWTAASESAPAPQMQVLVAPEALRTADADALRLIDSLRRAGASVHGLAAGLPALSAAEVEARIEHPPPPDTTVPNIWSLLREADAALPKGSEIVVVAPSRLAFVGGARPALRSSVRWHEAGSRATNRWIAAARRVAGDSVRAVVGTSTPQHARWHDYVFPAEGASGAAPLALRGDTLRLTQSDAFSVGDARAIAAPGDTLRLAIVHHPDRAADAQYVAAAFRVAARYARQPARITQFDAEEGPNQNMTEKADWLFWLHPESAPEALRQRVAGRGTLVEDAAGDSSEAVASVVVMPGGEGMDLSRRTPAPVAAGRTLWTDGFGRPLLTETRGGDVRRLRFYSRLHPSWNGLVLSAVFPEWALRQLLTPPSIAAAQDLRRISARQRQAARDTMRPAVQTASQAEPVTVRLHLPLWLLAVLLFACERWLASRSDA